MSLDLEDRLVRDLPRVADDILDGRVVPSAADLASRRRYPLALAAALVLIVAATAGVVAWQRDSGGSREVATDVTESVDRRS